MRQIETGKARRQAIRKESARGSLPYERAAEIASTLPNVQRLRQLQDSDALGVRRLTDLLPKIERSGGKEEALEDPEPGNDSGKPMNQRFPQSMLMIKRQLVTIVHVDSNRQVIESK